MIGTRFGGLLVGALLAVAACASPRSGDSSDGASSRPDASALDQREAPDGAGPGGDHPGPSPADAASDLAGGGDGPAGEALAQDAAPPDAPQPTDLAPDTVPSCNGIADCVRGHNCSARRCVPAPVSCGALKSDDPAAGDGVYWINPGGVPLRAYCDMRELVELCTEVEGERRGRTRDPARLVYRMVSVLDAGAGVCRLWALRGLADGHPLELFSPVDQEPQDTCRTLGFRDTDELGRCLYGSMPTHGTCGFPVADYLLWGNHCRGCTQNDGDHDRYVLQGPVFTGFVLSSLDGAVSTRCKTR